MILFEYSEIEIFIRSETESIWLNFKAPLEHGILKT